MAFKTASNKGSWFNPAAEQAWTKAGSSYAQMTGRVEDAAQTAADRHIVRPTQEAALRDPSVNGEDNSGWNKTEAVKSLGVFADEEGGMFVGVSAEHQQAFNEMEYGTETQPPSPHFRNAWLDNKKDANQTFQRLLTP